MEATFEEAMVFDFDQFLSACAGLPDQNDAHVVAAALKMQAAVIVTDNLRDFPEELLRRLNLEARSADAFIADTIALGTGRAVAAIRRTRERLRKPEKTADVLLLDMEANGLTETVDVLKAHILSLFFKEEPSALTCGGGPQQSCSTRYVMRSWKHITRTTFA